MIQILIAEQDKKVFDALSQYFSESIGYTVEYASSPSNAMDLINKNHYDAIVSDYAMPEKNGVEFLKELRSTYAHIPFIFYSSKTDESVIIDAFRCGADGFVMKSGNANTNENVEFIDIQHQIESAVKKRRAEYEICMKDYAIDVSLNSVIMYNEDKKIIYINNSALKLHNYKDKEEVLGRPISDLLIKHTSDKEKLDLIEKDSVNESVSLSATGIKKDGEVFPITASFTHIFGKLHMDPYYFVSYVDISEKIAVEQELFDYITEITRRLKVPACHINRSLSEIKEIIGEGDKDENSKLNLKLAVQSKNAEQIVENIDELTKEITGRSQAIPKEYKKYLVE